MLAIRQLYRSIPYTPDHGHVPEHDTEPSHLPPAVTRLPVPPDHGTTVPEHYQVNRYLRRLRRLPQSSGPTAQYAEPLSPAFKEHSSYKYPHLGLRYGSILALPSSIPLLCLSSSSVADLVIGVPFRQVAPGRLTLLFLQESFDGGSADPRRLMGWDSPVTESTIGDHSGRF